MRYSSRRLLAGALAVAPLVYPPTPRPLTATRRSSIGSPYRRQLGLVDRLGLAAAAGTVVGPCRGCCSPHLPPPFNCDICDVTPTTVYLNFQNIQWCGDCFNLSALKANVSLFNTLFCLQNCGNCSYYGLFRVTKMEMDSPDCGFAGLCTLYNVNVTASLNFDGINTRWQVFMNIGSPDTYCNNPGSACPESYAFLDDMEVFFGNSTPIAHCLDVASADNYWGSLFPGPCRLDIAGGHNECEGGTVDIIPNGCGIRQQNAGGMATYGNNTM